MQHQNRRNHPRMGVSYSLFARLPTHQINLSAVNLNFGGAFLKSEQKLPTENALAVGHTITLVLDQEGDMIETQAKIIHRHHDGFGMIFLKPSQAFSAAICKIISRQILEDTELGPKDYGVPGRIAVLVHEPQGSQTVFTSNLGERGIWVLTNEIHAYADLLRITLLEHGLFDCETQVLWCTEAVMALEFIDPPAEFLMAYQRILNAFMY
jgi:hypothetical protein